MGDRVGRAVREVDQDAEPVAFLHDLLAEVGQAVVLGLLGLEVAERVLDVVHELQVADAEIVGELQLARVIDEARAFDSEHDVRLAFERGIDVLRRQHDLEVLLGKVRLDERDVLVEPVERLAGLGDADLLQTLRRGADPGHVADERPGEQLHVAGGHGGGEGALRRRVVAEEEQVEVHVREVDLVAGKCEPREGEWRREAGQQEASTIHQALPLPRRMAPAAVATAGSDPRSLDQNRAYERAPYCITMVAT